MNGTTARSERPDGGRPVSGDDTLDLPVLLVAAALLGGAVAWTLHLVVGVALVGDACEASRRWPLQVVNGVSLLLALGALAATRVVHRAGQVPPQARAAAGPRRARFLSTVAWFLNILFTALIVFESFPTLFLDPCH